MQTTTTSPKQVKALFTRALGRALNPALVARLERAEGIVLTGYIERLDDDLYIVSSHADGTGFYRVRLGEKLAECSCECPDSRHRQDAAQVPCKHTLAALAVRRLEREATWHRMDDAAAWAAIA